MAEVRQDRGGILPRPASGGRSVAVLVMALIAVLAAIALIFNASRRSAHQAPAPISENVQPPAAPPEPPAPGPEPSPAVSPVPVADDGAGSAASARRQAAIARAIDDGRPGLTACYQRALVRDDSLVHGKVKVRASIAASGRVDSVNVAGPAAFRAMQPCLHRAISRWDFPAAPAPYTAEIPLVLQGNQ